MNEKKLKEIHNAKMTEISHSNYLKSLSKKYKFTEKQLESVKNKYFFFKDLFKEKP